MVNFEDLAFGDYVGIRYSNKEYPLKIIGLKKINRSVLGLAGSWGGVNNKNNEKELRSDFPDYAIMQCLDSSEILQYSIYIFYDSEIIRKIPKLEFL